MKRSPRNEKYKIILGMGTMNQFGIHFTDSLGLDESKKRQRYAGARQKLAPEQISLLLEVFKINPKPATEVRNKLATKLEVSSDKIKNWFQNRRAKERKRSVSSPLHSYNTMMASQSVFNIYPSCNDLYKRKAQ